MFPSHTFEVTSFPTTASLPNRPGQFVYVICMGTDEIPFYVGQTGRLRERMNDYKQKYFKSSTDFRVGEAIEYLSSKGNSIVVKYKQSIDPIKEEANTILDLQLRGIILLNCLRSYDYKSAQEDEERTIVRRFCDMLLVRNTT